MPRPQTILLVSIDIMNFELLQKWILKVVTQKFLDNLVNSVSVSCRALWGSMFQSCLQSCDILL